MKATPNKLNNTKKKNTQPHLYNNLKEKQRKEKEYKIDQDYS